LSITLAKTDRVEKVSNPLGDDERQNDGNAERDVSRTFDNDNRQTESHSRSTAQIRRRTDQHVLGYVRPLYTASK